jgi:hypothetical protein
LKTGEQEEEAQARLSSQHMSCARIQTGKHFASIFGIFKTFNPQVPAQVLIPGTVSTLFAVFKNC